MELRGVGTDKGIIRAQSNYAVLQTRTDGETYIYNAGRYLDEIVRVANRLLFKKKLCIFDTHRIATLMVAPIYERQGGPALTEAGESFD